MPASAQLPPLPTLPIPLPTLPIGSPSATATPSAAQTPTPAGTTPTPVETTSTPGPAEQGGAATVTSAADSFGSGGQTVDAGTFEVGNSSDADETITEVDIDVSDTRVVSSFTLTGIANGSSRTVTVSGPQQSNSFVFDPGLLIPAGQTGTFSLSATIASTGGTTTTVQPTVTVSSSTATPSGSTTPTPAANPFASATPATTATATPIFGATSTPLPSPTLIGKRDSNGRAIAFAAVIPEPHGIHPWRSLAILEMLAVLFGAVIGARAERRSLATLTFIALSIVALLWMQTFAGCGGQQSTTQTVTAISGTTPSNGTVTFSGVPLTLGSVARPQPFTFNSKLVSTANPTATP